MLPEAYLRYLQKALTPKGIDLGSRLDEDVRRIMREDERQRILESQLSPDLTDVMINSAKGVWDSEDSEGSFKIWEDHIRKISNTVLESLDNQKRNNLKDYAVGLLPTSDPNACSIAVPDGGYIIALDLGLTPFLFQMNTLLASTFGIIGFGGKLQNPVQDTKQISYDLYKIAQYYTNTLSRPIPSERKKYSFQTTMIASILSQIQLIFVLAHEFAHIIMGHLKEQDLKNLEYNEKKIAVNLFKDMPIQELEADLNAMDITQSVIHKFGNSILGIENAYKWIPASISILFIYFDLLEQLGFVPRNTNSHPSARERLNQVINVTNSQDKDELINLFDRAEKLCKNVHRPESTKNLKNFMALNAIRVNEGFYIPGEIIVNKHSISLLAILLRRLHIFELQKCAVTNMDWKLLEPIWRQIAKEIGQKHLAWASGVAATLQREGCTLNNNNIVDAHIDSYVEYCYQWWPFFSYVEKLTEAEIFSPVNFEDDPSEVGNLPKEESLKVLTETDLKYNWQLSRNLGIQRIMRKACLESNALLVSDTPIKFRAQWAPCLPDPENGRFIALIVAEWRLPTIPTLNPQETIDIRKKVSSESEAFWLDLVALYKSIHFACQNYSDGQAIGFLRNSSSQFQKSVNLKMEKIERIICSEYPERELISASAQLVIGPLASSPVLSPPNNADVRRIDTLEILDFKWFSELWRSCGLSLICKTKDCKDWPPQRAGFT